MISLYMDFGHRLRSKMSPMSATLITLIWSSIFSCDAVISSLDKVSSGNLGVDLVQNANLDIIGCLPCSQGYLIGSYFDNNSNPLSSNPLSLLDLQLSYDRLCEGLENTINVLRKSTVHWYLNGEGSHRHLVSSIEFAFRSDAAQWLDAHFCEVVIIERLPIEVFADPFELQRLVNRGVFSNAAVFGDTNLELPSALSNRSIIEAHMDIQHCKEPKSYEILVELPLHARYPQLDAGGYARVELGKPDMFMRCRPKVVQQETCLWTLLNLHVESGNKITWQIPRGNELHTGSVSGITFASALICALLIVISTISFSEDNDNKGS